MVLRPASSGTTWTPQYLGEYGANGKVIWTLKRWGKASYFYRAAATANPINEFGWRNPASYSGVLEKNEHIVINYNEYGDGGVLGRNHYESGITMYDGIPDYPGCCSSDLNRARNKALLELKDQTVNLSLAWKERQETADLVTSAITGVANIVRGVKTYLRNPRRRKQLLRKLKGKWKDAPEAWLLYRYGVVPTMLDAYGAAEALDKRDNGTYDRYMCTVRGKSTTALKRSLLSSGETYIGMYWPMLATVKKYRDAGSYGARVRYDCKLTRATYLRFSEVGVTNPLEMIWEGITFSFIADWFTSIGDFVSALDATVPFTFVGGSETIFVNWAGHTEITSSRGSVEFVVHTPASGRKFNRSTVSGFPFPDPFVLKQDPINLTRLADALSLLTSVCKSVPALSTRRAPVPLQRGNGGVS